MMPELLWGAPAGRFRCRLLILVFFLCIVQVIGLRCSECEIANAGMEKCKERDCKASEVCYIAVGHVLATPKATPKETAEATPEAPAKAPPEATTAAPPKAPPEATTAAPPKATPKATPKAPTTAPPKAPAKAPPPETAEAPPPETAEETAEATPKAPPPEGRRRRSTPPTIFIKKGCVGKNKCFSFPYAYLNTSVRMSRICCDTNNCNNWPSQVTCSGSNNLGPPSLLLVFSPVIAVLFKMLM